MHQKEKLSLSEKQSPSLWKKQETQSSPKTNLCKFCFKEIKENSFTYLLRNDMQICNDCFRSLEPIYEHFKIDGVDGFALYRYSEKFKSMLFQFKGCYDYELAPLFLERVRFLLKIKYFNYVIVPAPSTKEADEKRGFNHVEEVFKTLKRPLLHLVYKTSDVKQSSQGKDRNKIAKYLKIKNGEQIRGKNVLIVDDVKTSGATLKAMIALTRKYSPRRLKILVLSITDHDMFIAKSK